MKRFTIIFFSTLLFCFFPLTVLADNVPQKVLDASTSVVFIEVNSSDAVSSGSGFIASNGGDGTYIITNNHVIELNPKGVSVWTGYNEKRLATVVASSAQYDLAIIFIPEPLDADALTLSPNAEQGDEVFAAGFPEAANYLSNDQAHLSSEVTITNGIVSSVRKTKNVDYGLDLELLQINADLNPGNSGGPLLNQSGQVVGVNTYGVTDSQGIFGAIAAAELIQFISESKLFSAQTVVTSFPYWILFVGAGVILTVAIVFFIIFLLPRLKRKAQIRGLTLGEYLKQLNHPLEPSQAVSLLMPVVLQLREKHNQGTVYLNLSPSRVLVKKDGCHLRDSTDVATDEFFAPEQRAGKFAGIKADIYGVCALLRHMLTQYSTDTSEGADDASVEAIEAILRKGTSAEPDERYANMGDLVQDLAPFNTGISEDSLTPLLHTKPMVRKVPEAPDGTAPNDTNKKKPHRLSFILISAGVVLLVTIGFFTLSYFTAIDCANQYDFEDASAWFYHIPFANGLFYQDATFIEAGADMDAKNYDSAIVELNSLNGYPGVSGLLNEVKYRKAASLANQNEFDEAVAIYEEISTYKDSANLVNDTKFRKASYLLETKRFEDALDLLRNLEDENYDGTADKILELYYVWGNKLIEDGDYLLAYKKLSLSENYADTKQILWDLTAYIYDYGIELYHKGQYDKAEDWFKTIDTYVDSGAYLMLISVHQFDFEFSDYMDVYYNLHDLIGFEDAAVLIVSEPFFAFLFLEGSWRGDSHYFIMESDSYIRFDIPWFNYGDYYRIENGIIMFYKKSTPEITKNFFSITVVNENCILIFSYKNGRTYTLYRQ